MKLIATILILLTFFSCRSVNKTEVSGKYQNIRPTYPELARYVITDWVKGARIARDKLIFGEDNSFIMMNRNNDTTVAGTWKVISGNKIETIVNWNDSIYKKTYTSQGDKLYTFTTSYSCVDTAMIKPRKMLTVYQKALQ